ncbi:hypothetical protein NQ314_003855 [Rhamnusium bicolor]|uniref:Uncharacterized protein n=1 Tax=Rhamnusium bicolor TaxID=1586634 RepID=A0AAV8ZNR8_9CUCU|nr:hypothetical protein NQ314_003855 [Rhamnusium bicolor]
MDTNKSVIAQELQDTVSPLPAADGEIKEIKASVADKPKDVIEILTDEIDNITDKVTAADKLVEVSKASTDNVLDSKTKVTEEVKKDIVDSSNASSAEEKGVKSVTLEDTPRVKMDSAAEKLVGALERTALTPLKDVIKADKVSDNVGEYETSDFETDITISKKIHFNGCYSKSR